MLDTIAPVSPVYIILILGMVMFMASNAMPSLLPDPSQLGHLAPFVLQWGFLVVIFALLATMSGMLPGVPSLHITYVHMTCAGLLFGLMWNHIVANTYPDPPKKSSSSSSPSSSSSRSKECSSSSTKASKPEPVAPKDSPWDDLRAHPSAFLTTRMNRLLPWPFPMGKANAKGPELWWESGVPSHLGHFNKPAEPEEPKKAAEKDRKEKKESSASSEANDKEEKARKESSSSEKKADGATGKEQEKEKERVKASEASDERSKAREKEKEKEKARVKEKEEAKEKAYSHSTTETKAPSRDAGKSMATSVPSVPSASQRRIPDASVESQEERTSRRLLRTKYLALIVGLGYVDKTLGFFLLLLYTIRILAQALNGPGATAATSQITSTSDGDIQAARPAVKTAARKEEPRQRTVVEKPVTDKAAEAVKEKEQAKAKSSSQGSSSSSGASKEKEKERLGEPTKASSSRPAEKPSSSSSSSKEDRGSPRSSGEVKDTPRSSSSQSPSSSKGTITSAAVKEASGSRTETKPKQSEPSSVQPVGMGMHYIHLPDEQSALDIPPCFIPSEGMAHPLMTTLSKGWAN